MYASIREAVAHAQQYRGAGKIECEVRLGVRADARGTRAAGQRDAATSFQSNVSAKFFFATFAALEPQADEVSALERSATSFYEGAKARCETDGHVERWTDKSACGTAADWATAERGWWFDVRVRRSIERVVGVPDSVRYARAQAQMVSPLARSTNSRAIAATPVILRCRERRSLRFAAQPAWRIDFTVVQTHQRHVDASGGTGMAEAYLRTATDGHEIEIELVDLACPAERAAEQCFALIERLAYAMGRTRAEVVAYLRDTSRAMAMAI